MGNERVVYRWSAALSAFLSAVLSAKVLAETEANGEPDPVEVALAEVRDTRADFYTLKSSVLGTIAGPAEFAAVETRLSPGPRGSLPVAMKFSPEMARPLARQYRHVTFLRGKRRWQEVKTLGITGIHVRDLAATKEFVVVGIEDGSPAEDKVQESDIIIGANGRLFEDDMDPRVLMGYALAEAETEALGGVLTLQLVRDGVPMNVPLKIGVLRAYRPTWPYDCEKSKILAERAVRCVLDYLPPTSSVSNKYAGGSWWNALMLMGSGNDEALERVRRTVYGLAAQRYEFPVRTAGKASWEMGNTLVILAEYYLLTGDSHVLPAIENRTAMIEKGQSQAGSWGHALPCDGYGEVNATGGTCFMGLALARECGVKMDPVALPRAIRFFGKFAGGGIPYGNHPGGLFGGSDNGKNCMAALAFHVLGEADLAARFVRPVCYSYRYREFGHAASIFGPAWGPPAAALAPRAEFHMFMNNLIWFYEMGRSREGAIRFLRGRWNPVTGSTGAMALGLMLPRKQLRILGAPKGVFGMQPPEPLEEAASLYRDKKWAKLEAFLADYLKKPGIEHADYAKGLLAAYQRIEKHAEATVSMVKQNVEKENAFLASKQFEALKTLLGEERPKMAEIRKYLESDEGKQAVKGSEKQGPAKTLRRWSFRAKRGAETPIVWDDALPLAADSKDSYVHYQHAGEDEPELGDWWAAAYQAKGWKQATGPLKEGPRWVRRTFGLSHADHRYVKLLSNNGGEVYLNGHRLATLEEDSRRKEGTREAVLGSTAAGAVREGTNVLAARLTGAVVDVGLSVGPRKADSAALRKGLVAYCKFDEGEGAKVQATLPAELEGAITGSSQWAPGRLGRALELVKRGRSASTIVFPDYKDPVGGRGRIPTMTVSVWGKAPHKWGGLILSKGTEKGADGWWLSIQPSGTPELRFLAGNGWGKGLEVLFERERHKRYSSLPDGLNHYVVVYDGETRRVTIYRNGEVLKEEPIDPSFGQEPEAKPGDKDAEDEEPFPTDAEQTKGKEKVLGIAPSTEPLTIGSRFELAAIDELAIWNRALTKEEALSLCNGGLGLALEK